MAFIVTDPDTTRIVRNWPVQVPTALDGGNNRVDMIEVDYAVTTQDQIDDVVKDAQEAGENVNKALMRAFVHGIYKQFDKANNPVEHTPDTFEQALNRPNQLSAMVGAFFDVQNGRKAARKN